MNAQQKLRRGVVIALASLILTTLTVWAGAPTTSPAAAPAQQPAAGICQQRPLPDLSASADQSSAAPPETLRPIPAGDPQLDALREATFLLGEGDRLSNDGKLEDARAKWQEAVAAYQRAGDQLGEADAYLRLADSYPPLEAALDPAVMDEVFGYYEAAFFASADVYETLIQKEVTFDQDLLDQAETAYEQGRAFYEAGNCSDAQPLLEDARNLFKEADYGGGELRALMTMVRCQFNPDDPVSALNAFTMLLDALTIATNLPTGTPTTERYLEGVDLFEQGQWQDAQMALTEAQEQYQDAGDTIAAAHATQDLAGAVAAAGDLPRAEALYREALAVYTETPDEYSDYNQAGVYHNLGNIATLTGRYQEAIADYNTAVELWRVLGEPAQEVASLTGLGWVLRETGNYSEALATLESAQTIQQRLSPDPETEGDLLNNIALVYISLARYDQALDLLLQTLPLRRQLPHRQKELETLNNIASVEAYLGQFAAALDTYETILTIANETNASRMATATQANIASIYVQQGQYQQGLALYLAALPAYQQTGEQPAIASLEADIGAAYRALGDLDRARAHLTTALDLFETMGNFEGSAAVRNNLGAIALQSGDLPEATTCLEQTITIWQTLDNPTAVSLALANLAWTAAAQEEFDTAVSRGEEALTLTRQSGRQADEARLLLLLGLSHLGLGDTATAASYGQQAVDMADKLNDPAVAMAGEALLSATYAAEGERPLAYDHIQQAVANLEQLQGIITVAELKTSYLGQLADVYSLAVSLAADLGRDEEAFHLAEQARARAFLDQISSGAVDFRAQADADLLAQERDLQAQIAARRQQLTALYNRPGDEQDAAAIDAARAELTRLEAAYSDLLVELKVSNPNAAAWLASDVDSLSDIQSHLDVQTTLLEYFVTADKTLAFIITQADLTVVPLPEATPDALTTAITNLHQWLNTNEPHPRPLRDLYDLLAAPLVERLNTPQVGVIPHQMIHYVPFAALTNGETYLGQQHTLFLLPSASSLGAIQANAAALVASTRPALVFGSPATDDTLFPPLIHAADEAAAVAALLDAPVYTGTDAQETRFWSDVQGADVIHLAAHASYNIVNPLYSAIHLAPGSGAEAVGQDDGRLEAHEIYDLNLQSAQMVVLSACQTNVAKAAQAISPGDEIVGLTRAFFAAGTPTVISSLWPVDDAATEALMTSFYRHWQSGMDKVEALQAAQADVQAVYPGPFYWAGFVLGGDGGRIDNPQSPPPTAVPTSEPKQGGNGRLPGVCSSALILPLLLIGLGNGRRRKSSPS